ncbi:hypothetical protein BDR26DRAFT_920825 [Obelidium mucronatum]|nr:hypothetical protein BDR26DRAFT_920825 [Obelidium mucronatum]
MESEIFSQLRRGINDLEGSDAPFVNGTSSYSTAEDIVDDVATLTSVGAGKPTIDLNSEDLFPALPPSTSTAPKPTQAWRPAVTKSSIVEPGTKKLGSGKKVAESLEIPFSSQEKLPSTGKNSVADHARSIGLKHQVTIDVLANRTTFVITGRPDSVKLARRDFVTAIGVQVTEVVIVPSSVRPHLLGAGGKNLKDLTLRTGTSIQVPKAAKPEDGAEIVEDDEQPVTIKGNFEGVRDAKKEILELVLKKTQNSNSRLIVDRAYHPFIAGANNSTVEAIEAKTGTRIHIPPLVVLSEKKEGAPEKNLNEIVIAGPRDGVKAAEEEIRTLYEELQRTTRTLSFPIKKRQHRFIIGVKGKNLQEILEATGCSVELPAASDPSDVVTVRGPDNMLSVALQSVLQKSNQVSLEEIHVARAIPASTNPLLFLRYLFTKEIAEIKKIETANNVSVHRMLENPSDPVIEIQGKTKLEAESARIQLNQLVQEWGQTLFFGEVEIPHGLHKFVVGKGGANIVKMKAQPVWEGRLADVLVPSESEGSDEILLVVRRLPRGLGGAPNAKAAAKKPAGATKAEAEDDAEVSAFAEKVRAEILSVSLANADFTSEVVAVPGKFHGRLIGAGGKDLKELLSAYGDEVSIRFPAATGKEDKKKDDKKVVDADTVVIKGPKKLVADCKTKISKILVELKRIETLGSFTDTLKVKKGTGKKLREGAGAPVSSGSNIVNDQGRSDTIGWLIRLIKENLIAHPPKSSDAVTAENNHMLSLLKVEVTESTKDADDVITFTGPKDIVAIAKKIISDRAVRLANQVTLEFKVFQICSKAAKDVLQENLIPDLKSRVMRKLIGREGKSVKALMDKYAVSIQFPEGGKKRKNRNAEEEVEEVEAADEEEEESSNSVVDGIVIVKGNPKDVESAKAEILKISEAEIVNSFTTTFEVPRSVLPQILGASGSKIKALRDSHNVRIDLKDFENEDGEVSVLISLEGSKTDCLAVEKKILGVTDELVNVEVRAVAVPSYLHKDIIGASGTRIKAVIDAFGGQEKVKVQFPPRGDSAIGTADSNFISCKAHVRQIDELVAAVLNVVNEVLAGDEEASDFTLIDENTDDTTAEVISIPKSDVSRVLGKGGDSIKFAMRTFRVIYWFTEKAGDSEHVNVKVVGLADNVEGIRQAVEDIKGKLRASKKVALPLKVRENLATAGAVHDAEAASVQELIKKIRAESSGAASAEISNSSLAGSEDAHITVRGDSKYVDLAVKSLEKGLKELTKYDVTVRIPVEADMRGHIIGKAGSTISKIRTETEAFVELARGSGRNAGDVVVIRGTTAAVEKATEQVQKIIADQAGYIAADKARRAAAAAAAAKQASSFSVGPARIDDAVTDGSDYVAAPSGPASIPGFAPSQRPAKGQRPSVPVTVVSSAPSYYSSFTSAPVEDSWKPVAKKGKKEEEVSVVGGAPAAADVPGSGPSKKKKKSKKASAGSTEVVDAEVEALAEVVVVAPVRAPSPARARSPSPAKVASAPVAPATKKPAAVNTLKPAVSAPTPTPSPAVATASAAKAVPAVVPAVAPAPRVAPVVEDDGWTVIPKKGAAADDVSGEAAKKKKKNKKKKKTAAVGATENGNDEDDGDE